MTIQVIFCSTEAIAQNVVAYRKTHQIPLLLPEPGYAGPESKILSYNGTDGVPPPPADPTAQRGIIYPAVGGESGDRWIVIARV